MMKVRNMVSNNGNTIPNQFILRDTDIITFQSYESMIIEINLHDMTVKVGRDYNYSRTTGKYRNQFFSEVAPFMLRGLNTTKELEKALKVGEYNGYKVLRVNE